MIPISEQTPSSQHYTVKSGDWLAKVARTFGESWQQLYKDNRETVGDSPDLIYPGTVLNVRHRTAAVGHSVRTGSAVSHAAESVALPRTTKGAVAVAYARMKIGAHYQWGATGPRVFDCSGLVYASWRKAGVHLLRTANQMWKGLPHVSLAHLRVGDIVAFGYRSLYADHVGIYAGHGLLIGTSSHRPGGGAEVPYGRRSMACARCREAGRCEADYCEECGAYAPVCVRDNPEGLCCVYWERKHSVAHQADLQEPGAVRGEHRQA